ncbi:hypothetical protein KDK95_03115 [Actinospica sp. MGRD01-02]|uniref:Uncharacterized protein n=1 Tax=Actinospica acidithermotolerans TaxID=2828514 RepID=A0A941IHK6_9ACTN|nr:hypothetical protein [Actinospica acidithermotolerans]MBR7825283.1 hypothetical protein [Actinospica acidithermotolerans]
MSFTTPGTPASPWPFGDPVATALLGLLEVELRGHGLHWRVVAPERLEVFRSGAARPERTIDVAALRERMAREAKADWPDLVEQAVAGWLAAPTAAGGASANGFPANGFSADGLCANGSAAHGSVPATPPVPAWAAPLRSRLLPTQLAAATAGALARPALPGLSEVVLCETGPRGGGRLLAAEQAGNWPAPTAEIFAAARANVRNQGVLPTERRAVDGANLTLLSGPGPYCPTHVFWLGEYLRRDGAEVNGNGALVVLPHRHLVAYHAIETQETVTAAGALLRLATRQFETAPGALTDQIYWWRDDQVSALPVDAAGETLTILPTPEFGDLLDRLPAI